MAGSWSSLEVAKLAAAVLTPLAVVFLGLLVTQTGRRLEAAQWANQTVIEHRLAIYEKAAWRLNRLYCFAMFIGRWKEIGPSDAVEHKRELDELMYPNAFLFGGELLASYEKFMKEIFSMYANAGEDALLKVEIESALGDRRNLSWWHADLEARFVVLDESPRDRVAGAYHELMHHFRDDLYITREDVLEKLSPRPPSA